MSTSTKDYSGERYDTVREHFTHPLPSDFEAFDRRRAENWPDHVDTPETAGPGEGA
jgi:hypothetical protein